MFMIDVIFQMHFMSQPPRLAGQWPTQMLYRKRLRTQKECSWPYDFYGAADMSVGDISCSISIIEL